MWSLTTGLALQVSDVHRVDNALSYGSPGIEETSPQQLGLEDGRVPTMLTPDDSIPRVYDGPHTARALAPRLPLV